MTVKISHTAEVQRFFEEAAGFGNDAEGRYRALSIVPSGYVCDPPRGTGWWGRRCLSRMRRGGMPS